jgi:peroxiredoxin Q/BCP
MPVQEGKAAPAFTLKDQDGEKIALRDLKGRHVIVYFYPRDDTSGCTKEAQGFKKLLKKFEKQDAVILGVIRSTVWIGPDGKVRKHWARVAKAADHPQKVLEEMESGA